MNEKQENMNATENSLRNEMINALPYFTGTENMFEHKTFFGKFLLSDGANYIREKAQARWLYDAIMSYQGYSNLKAESFQSWTLEKVSDLSFLLSCDDGNGNVLAKQKIQSSDFPLQSITIWLCDGVCLLPSEY